MASNLDKVLAETKQITSNKKKMRSKWYNINSLMGYDWANFLYITGAGGVGKSYSVLNWLLNRKMENKEHVHLYLARLTDKQVAKVMCDNAKTLIDPDLRRKYNLDIRTRGETVYYGKTIKHKAKTGTITTKFEREGELCRVIALSTCFNDKGNGIFDNQMDPNKDEIYIFADEFVRDEESGETNRFDIVDNMTEQLETLARSFHGKIKVIFCSNLVGSSELLAHWNFIPRESGRYKLKSKYAVIDVVAESEEFNEEERKTSIAYKFNKKSKRFRSKIDSDGALIASKQAVRERKPQYILAFAKDKQKWFTVSGNIVTKYNGECKPVFGMLKYLDQRFDQDMVKTIQQLYNSRALLFDNCSTYTMFTEIMERYKK